MSIFVVCGSPSSRIESIFHLLEGQGVKKVLAAKYQRGLGIEDLLSRLVPQGSNISKKSATLKPGKVFEQAAGDILIANWEQAHWGWADSRNVWILDFLKSLDQSIRFLLIHESPERALARVLNQTLASLDVDATITDWLDHERAMLRFYHRNREQSLLLDAEASLNHPKDLVNALGEMSDLSFDPFGVRKSEYAKIPALALLIGKTELQQHPEALAFNQEIESSLSLGIEASTADQDVLAIDAAKDYRRLIDDLERLEQEAKGKAELLATKDDQITGLSKERSELITARNQLIQSTAEQKAQLDQLIQAREAEIKEKNVVISQRDAEAKSKLEAHAQLASTRKAAAEAELVKDNRIKALEEEIRSKASKDQQSLNLEIQRLKDQEAAIVRRLKDEAEENELLLAQLHQVQEELEHYFLKFQESQQVAKRHESQIQRLIRKDRSLYDIESLRLVEKTRDGSDIHTHWELQGFAASGRIVDKLQVSLVRESGYPQIWIHQDEAQEALVRWPSQCQADKVLKIQPEGSDTTRLLRLSTLFALSQADWEFMGRVWELFSEELGKLVSTGASRLERSEIMDCLAIANEIGRQLGGFPSIWRFGKVQLKNLQINPDYAHLWLELEDAKFGDQEWPRFEFRLSAAHIDQHSFANFPKLEFPEISGEPPQFSGWFEESRDDFGAKFEIRFNRVTGDLNLEALNHLTARDREQLLQLIGSLPEILSHLSQVGGDLGRPVLDWQETVTTILKILDQSQAAPQAPEAAPEERPKKSSTPRTQKKSLTIEAPPKAQTKPVRKSS